MKTFSSISNDELRRRTERDLLLNPEGDNNKQETDSVVTNPKKFISVLKSRLSAFKSPLKEYSEEISTNKLVLDSLRSRLGALDLGLSRCFPPANNSYMLSEEQSSKIINDKLIRAQEQPEKILEEASVESLNTSISEKGKEDLPKKWVENVNRPDITWTDEVIQIFEDNS